MSMATGDALLKQLKDPFDPKFVKWRVGATNKDKTKGIALAYIDSREVMKRFDKVCKIGGWQNRMIPLTDGFICEIDVRIDGEWITRSNAAGNTQVEAVKGGASDAFKRAGASWGVGRYLYYLPNIWVPIIPQGRSYVLAETPDLPGWAKPDPNIVDWETVAELEVDLNTSGDEDPIDPDLFAAYGNVQNAKTSDELQKIVGAFSVEYQMSLQAIISKKTEELLTDESDTTKNKA